MRDDSRRLLLENAVVGDGEAEDALEVRLFRRVTLRRKRLGEVGEGNRRVEGDV